MTPVPRRVFIGLLVAVVSCSRPAPVVVTQLVIDDFEGADVVGMTRDQLQQRLTNRLEMSRFVLLRVGEVPPAGGGWVLKVAVGLKEPDAETGQGSRVSVVMHLRRYGAPEGFEVRSVVPSAPPTNDVEALQTAARQALDRALEQVLHEAKALIDLEPAKDEVLIETLKQRDESVRAAAARLLVRRGNPAALSALLGRLNSPDLDVVREAVGLLVELKAPGAVNPMIEATRNQGPIVEREIVFAVGAIGGEDAEAYLDLVASGHDDPVVRASAEAALRELRARRAGQGVSK